MAHDFSAFSLTSLDINFYPWWVVALVENGFLIGLNLVVALLPGGWEYVILAHILPSVFLYKIFIYIYTLSCCIHPKHPRVPDLFPISTHRRFVGNWRFGEVHLRFHCHHIHSVHRAIHWVEYHPSLSYILAPHMEHIQHQFPWFQVWLVWGPPHCRHQYLDLQLFLATCLKHLHLKCHNHKCHNMKHPKQHKMSPHLKNHQHPVPKIAQMAHPMGNGWGFQSFGYQSFKMAIGVVVRSFKMFPYFVGETTWRKAWVKSPSIQERLRETTFVHQWFQLDISWS